MAKLGSDHRQSCPPVSLPSTTQTVFGSTEFQTKQQSRIQNAVATSIRYMKTTEPSFRKQKPKPQMTRSQTTEANQALEPTTTAVTPRADARVAPAAVAAHL